MFDILCFCKKHLHIWSLQKSCRIFLTWNQTMKWYKSHKKCPSNTFFFCLKDQRLWRFCKCVQKCNFGTELYYQLSPFYHDFALWGQHFLEVNIEISIPQPSLFSLSIILLTFLNQLFNSCFICFCYNFIKNNFFSQFWTVKENIKKIITNNCQIIDWKM